MTNPIDILCQSYYRFKRSTQTAAMQDGFRAVGVLLALSLTANTQASIKSDNFVLIDHQGIAQELYYHNDATAIVLIAHSDACEAVTQSTPDYRSLKSNYGTHGVRFFMINSADSRAVIIESAEKLNLDIPILHDSAKIIGKSLGIKSAGEVLVIDPKTWQIAYRGSPANPNLRGQLDSLANGTAISFQQNDYTGCAINDAPKTEPQPNVADYATDIAPILEKNCMACHVEGGIAPWAMSEYAMVKGFAPMIREVIRVKRMPPWHADPEVGHWKRDSGLIDADALTLVNWIEAGAPRGEGVDPLSATRPAKAVWPLGEPDLILELPAYDVPASGIVEYTYPVIVNPLDHDVWVEAATVLPGNTEVVHHVLLGSAEQVPEEDDLESVFQNYIMGYAPGNESAHMPEGTGVLVPVGGVYQLQMHYTPMGIAATDTTRVGLYFADKPPSNFLRQQAIVNPKLKIPANTEAHEESAYFEFWDDAIIYSMLPHSHYRGKSSTFELLYPDGTTELIFSAPNYNFDWQRTYNLAEPKQVPKGTKIIHRTVFDNSAKNPSNPNPNRVVPWGLQSHDEMLYGSVSYSWVHETSKAPTHTYLRADTAQFMGFADKNLDGKLSKQELPGRMRKNLGWFKWWFVDTNFDGGLDMDELQAMFSR